MIINDKNLHEFTITNLSQIKIFTKYNWFAIVTNANF